MHCNYVCVKFIMYVYMLTIDLKHANLLVSIDRKYLRFLFERHLYQVYCMLFGLCSTTYRFTEFLRAVIENLRK